MNGATNPEFDIVARAGAQVKLALDTAIKLGGLNYVWGGRGIYHFLTLIERNLTTWLSLEYREIMQK